MVGLDYLNSLFQPLWFYDSIWLVTLQGPTLEQSAPDGLYLVEGSHAGIVHEELQPVGRTHIGQVHGGLYPTSRTPCWSRGRLWEGRSGRDKVWWTDHKSHCPSLCLAWREKVEKNLKWSWAWEAGRGGGKAF